MFTTIWAKNTHKKHLIAGAFYFIFSLLAVGQIPTFRFQSIGGTPAHSLPYFQKYIGKQASTADFDLQMQVKEFEFKSKDLFQFHADIFVVRDTISGPQLLYSYKSQFKTQGYKSKAEHGEEMAKLSSQSLSERFNAWWKNNWDRDPKLIQEVRVDFLPDYLPQKAEEDTLFYGQKTLDWGDFKSKSYPGSRFAAQIFSNFEYHAFPKIEKGILYLPIQVKVYMLRSHSWKKENLPDRALEHELTHFKITHQAAQQFKDQIKRMKLRPLWYDSELQWWFLDAYRWMNNTQKTYDTETGHGIHPVEQEKWNDKFR
ncbi:hypothetical protein ESB04_03940 [Aquirufa rosea]|uniref:DUF922 domain-containing protein n=2 Tax=Aquirufa rosea TaxID=2509241 RepID=A0A4Q1C1A0_9BACT|nr:hypothetical protein ESB04_03940 [Aquirufa rosea]